MDGDSRIKVLAAGFKIIRASDEPTPRIKYCVTYGSWATLETGFKSKAARDRRFKELMKDDKIIND
jgi:hypothetical protein